MSNQNLRSNIKIGIDLYSGDVINNSTPKKGRRAKQIDLSPSTRHLIKGKLYLI